MGTTAGPLAHPVAAAALAPAAPAARPWTARLEARVALALGLLVAAALAAVFLLATGVASSQSRERAGLELDVARSSFHALVRERASAASSAAALVTELPVFRAHLTDARLAADRETVAAMADQYRAQLDAQFAIVARQDGAWAASPGWVGLPDPPGGALHRANTGALAGRRAEVLIAHGGSLYLIVTVPARFADEILGALTLGYRLTDALAEQLARLAKCEVVLLSGDGIAASSLPGARADVVRLVPTVLASANAVLPGLLRLGDRQFVAGVFDVAGADLDGSAGRMLLLSDWQPTQTFVDGLRVRFAVAGLAVLALSIAGGVVFSRRLSRPLRDIATAASEIAAGNLALTLPERGTTESAAVARAFNDMSASLRTAQERLMHDATHDGLTRLPNRMLFMERLDRALLRRVRHPQYSFAVLFIDLDRFKTVNDSLGHGAGDELLVRFADRLAGIVRRDDLVSRVALDPGEGDASTLARFGGDEFVVLLDDIRGPVDAVRVAERIQRLATQAFTVGGQEVFTAPSIGVAVAGPSHRDAGDLVRDADLAMYRAKHAGGNGYAVFDGAMHAGAIARLRLETELRNAVDRQEFRVYYQPIVALADRRIAGFEALVRWAHPGRGLLSPAEFLGAAEDMGLVAQIDAFVLREACRQGVAWHRARPDTPPSLSVNLSGRSFAQPSLAQHVADVLAETGFAPSALRLEITESVAITDAARAREVLADLRALGVRVSVDDFGTGYSSLSYLQTMPVDVLKIDRSFVSAIAAGARGEIVQLIVGLALALDLEVVAEGTETEAQVEYLTGLGCTYGQGYFFGRPVPPDEAWPAA